MKAGHGNTGEIMKYLFLIIFFTLVDKRDNPYGSMHISSYWDVFVDWCAVIFVLLLSSLYCLSS